MSSMKCAAALLAIAAGLTSLTPRPAVAQTRFEITLFGGLTTFLGRDPTGTSFNVPDAGAFGSVARDAESGVDPSYTLGLAGRLRTGRRLGFEVSAAWTPTDVSPAGASGGMDLTVAAYTASALLYLPSGRSGVEPFLALGGGARVYDANETRVYPSWSVGGGASVPVGRGVALRFEVRDYMALSDASDFQSHADPGRHDHRFQSDLALTAGLTFFKPRPSRL